MLLLLQALSKVENPTSADLTTVCATVNLIIKNSHTTAKSQRSSVTTEELPPIGTDQRVSKRKKGTRRPPMASSSSALPGAPQKRSRRRPIQSSTTPMINTPSLSEDPPSSSIPNNTWTRAVQATTRSTQTHSRRATATRTMATTTDVPTTGDRSATITTKADDILAGMEQRYHAMTGELSKYECGDPYSGAIMFQAQVLLATLMDETLLSEHPTTKFCTALQRLTTKCRKTRKEQEQRPSQHSTVA